MEYRTELMRLIDKFSLEAVEEFKEAEGCIIRDSTFTSIIKKKDYDGHLRMLTSVKKKAQGLDPKAIKLPEDDENAIELKKAFEKSLMVFSSVCDGYIQMQTALKDKSVGEKVKYSQFKQLNDKVRDARKKLNDSMRDMDIIYSDFMEFHEDSGDDDFGGVEYRTYDSFK